MAEFNISFVGLVTAKPTTAGSMKKSGCRWTIEMTIEGVFSQLIVKPK